MIWLEWLWLFAVLAAMASMARLDPFTRGTIVGLRAAGVTRDDIVQRVKKKTASVPPCERWTACLRGIAKSQRGEERIPEQAGGLRC